MTESKYLSGDEILKKLNEHGISKERFEEAILKKELPTMVIHPITGKYTRYNVTSIDPNTGDIEGFFLDD